jgi:hypothetical protein
MPAVETGCEVVATAIAGRSSEGCCQQQGHLQNFCLFSHQAFNVLLLQIMSSQSSIRCQVLAQPPNHSIPLCLIRSVLSANQCQSDDKGLFKSGNRKAVIP